MELVSDFLDDTLTALLLITHDLGLAARRVDRLILMEAGRIVEQGRTEDILERPKTQAAQMLASHRNWMELPC